MSTNQTQHLHLSQWEENDEILRTDFNADNAKLDAALAALSGAFTPDNDPLVLGSYKGNGAEYQNIVLGFRPRLLLVAYNGLIAYGTNGITVFYGGILADAIAENGAAVRLTDNGFQARSPGSYVYGNQSGTNYLYIALK